jgi:hypothetical protein
MPSTSVRRASEAVLQILRFWVYQHYNYKAKPTPLTVDTIIISLPRPFGGQILAPRASA